MSICHLSIHNTWVSVSASTLFFKTSFSENHRDRTLALHWMRLLTLTSLLEPNFAHISSSFLYLPALMDTSLCPRYSVLVYHFLTDSMLMFYNLTILKSFSAADYVNFLLIRSSEVISIKFFNLLQAVNCIMNKHFQLCNRTSKQTWNFSGNLSLTDCFW